MNKTASLALAIVIGLIAYGLYFSSKNADFNMKYVPAAEEVNASH